MSEAKTPSPAQRLNATVRPSGETAGEKSSADCHGGGRNTDCDGFCGREVKLCVSPLSVDNSAKPSVTTHLPSGSQAKKEWKSGPGKGMSATMRSDPPIEGMTMKTER